MTDPGRDKYSESTLRLAERYGIDPARLDAMLGKPREDAAQPAEPTREWIDERRIHQPNADVPPVAATTVPPKEPVKIVDPVIASGPKQTRKVKDIRVEGSALNNPGGQTYVYKKEVTSPVTWIIGIAILALLAIMFFATRGCDKKPAPQPPTQVTVIDSVVKTDTVAVKDTVAVPVPNVTAPPSQPKPRTRRTSSASSGSRNVALSTTSSFAAQEKLAELKADGNTRANIKRVTKNGVTLYQVRTK